MTERERRQIGRLLEQLYTATMLYNVDAGELRNVDVLVVSPSLNNMWADLPMLILAMEQARQKDGNDAR